MFASFQDAPLLGAEPESSTVHCSGFEAGREAASTSGRWLSNKEIRKMPLAGKGMLLTSMDIDPAHEREFNLWDDNEHLEERVAIDGFLEARRYVAHAARPKYLSLYSTESFEVLDSPAYRKALANQTEWSGAN